MFDSEFVMHVHKGPCEMPARVDTSAAVTLEHGVGGIGATESFVYQLTGKSEVVQSPHAAGPHVLRLQGGDMTVVEVRTCRHNATHCCLREEETG